jgi:hypothetical protein
MYTPFTFKLEACKNRLKLKIILFGELEKILKAKKHENFRLIQNRCKWHRRHYIQNTYIYKNLYSGSLCHTWWFSVRPCKRQYEIIHIYYNTKIKLIRITVKLLKEVLIYILRLIYLCSIIKDLTALLGSLIVDKDCMSWDKKFQLRRQELWDLSRPQLVLDLSVYITYF